jgi:hypothetical protein
MSPGRQRDSTSSTGYISSRQSQRVCGPEKRGLLRAGHRRTGGVRALCLPEPLEPVQAGPSPLTKNSPGPAENAPGLECSASAMPGQFLPASLASALLRTAAPAVLSSKAWEESMPWETSEPTRSTSPADTTGPLGSRSWMLASQHPESVCPPGGQSSETKASCLEICSSVQAAAKSRFGQMPLPKACLQTMGKKPVWQRFHLSAKMPMRLRIQSSAPIPSVSFSLRAIASHGRSNTAQTSHKTVHEFPVMPRQ